MGKTCKPNFILGVGAQKAGTTWLFDYLDGHPQCRMGPFKEMNFFKAPGVSSTGRKRQMKKPAWRMSRHENSGRDTRIAASLEAQLIRFRPEYYAQIYHRIAEQSPEARLIGDLSPKYATLGLPGMRRMKSYLDDMGYPVKVVLLLRDPVRRCFSAARMAERGQGSVGKKSQRGKSPTPTFSGAGLFDFASCPGSVARTRYEQIITRLEMVFAPAQIFYGVYEDFFTEQEVARLCNFLEIEALAPKFNARPHADKTPKVIPTAEAARIRDFYAETYAFCRARFGKTRIDALWTG